jgi:hypothetical protein
MNNGEPGIPPALLRTNPAAPCGVGDRGAGPQPPDARQTSTKAAPNRAPQDRSPAHPAPPAHPGRARRPGHKTSRLREVSGVVIADQRAGIRAHRLGDGTDMPPGVKIATTRGIVIALDATNDGLPDAGPLADLGHGQTGPAARSRQVFTDAHPAPPPPAKPRAPHRARAQQAITIITPPAPNRARGRHQPGPVLDCSSPGRWVSATSRPPRAPYDLQPSGDARMATTFSAETPCRCRWTSVGRSIAGRGPRSGAARATSGESGEWRGRVYPGAPPPPRDERHQVGGTCTHDNRRNWRSM